MYVQLYIQLLFGGTRPCVRSLFIINECDLVLVHYRDHYIHDNDDDSDELVMSWKWMER